MPFKVGDIVVHTYFRTLNNIESLSSCELDGLYKVKFKITAIYSSSAVELTPVLPGSSLYCNKYLIGQFCMPESLLEPAEGKKLETSADLEALYAI